MSKKIVFEKFEISAEQKIGALCALEDEGRTILCSRCHSPMRSHTVKMVYLHGTVYAQEFFCTGYCGNRIVPSPKDTHLGRFLEKRAV